MADEMTTPSQSPVSYDWLRQILRPLQPRLKELLLQSFFINLLALAVPLFSLQVYDRVVGHRGLVTLVALCCGVALAFLFDYLLRVARSRLLQDTALRIDIPLGRWLYEKLAGLPLAVVESRSSAYWRGLFQDASAIRAVFSGHTALLLADTPFAVLFLLVIAVIATPLFWLLMLVIPLFLLLGWWSTRKLNDSAAQEWRHFRHHESYIAELLAGQGTVKSLQADRMGIPEWEALYAASLVHSRQHGEGMDKAVLYGQMLASATTVLLVACGALAILEQSLTMGALIATTMLSSRILGPLNQLVAQWKSFARCHQAMKELEHFAHLPQMVMQPAIIRPQPSPALVVEQVSYTHTGAGHPSIAGVHLAFRPGEIIGIVGRNGCGKSTLLKLMQGLYTPQQGRILLDGMDMMQLSRAELSAWIGYVPQECFLFQGTIRENLCKAWPDATDEAILQAVTMAGAESFINALPEGYATQIGENGFRLSGGQRQRLAIARALLQQPPILLLDEVTSHLDTEAEALLRNHLVQYAATGKLVVMATHSPQMLRACHRIMVMEAGQVAAQGDTTEILPKLLGA